MEADTINQPADREAISLTPLQIIDPCETPSSGSDSFKTEMYGALSSQYGGALDPPNIARLEKAILFCHVRAFEKAAKIFESFPINLRNHPVIVYEHSMVYWLQWSLLDCAKVLQQAFTWAETNAKSLDQPGIYTLLRVVSAKLNVFTKADFTRARDSMREIRAWLLNIPYSQYSEIQVKGKKVYILYLPRF